MQIGNFYLRSFDRLGRVPFSIHDFSAAHHTSVQSGKVLLHRLKKNGQALALKRGLYVLLSPKHYLMIRDLQKTNPRLCSLVAELYSRFPSLSKHHHYGSQVRGEAHPRSDYDVLLVLENPLQDSWKVRKDIEKALSIRLHLTVYSEGAFRLFSITEPYLKFWFSEGIVFDEKGLSSLLAKPVAKLGYMENLKEAETCHGIAEGERDPVAKSDYALRSLRASLLIKHAIHLDYDYANVSRELALALGPTWTKIRQGKAPKPSEIKNLLGLSRKTLREVEGMIGLLGENESDIFWRERRGEAVGA